MTDRVNALIVVLKKDMRDDDVQRIKGAIACFEHVLSVTNNVRDVGDLVAYERAKREITDRLMMELA